MPGPDCLGACSLSAGVLLSTTRVCDSSARGRHGRRRPLHPSPLSRFRRRHRCATSARLSRLPSSGYTLSASLDVVSPGPVLKHALVPKERALVRRRHRRATSARQSRLPSSGYTLSASLDVVSPGAVLKHALVPKARAFLSAQLRDNGGCAPANTRDGPPRPKATSGAIVRRCAVVCEARREIPSLRRVAGQWRLCPG